MMQWMYVHQPIRKSFLSIFLLNLKVTINCSLIFEEKYILRCIQSNHSILSSTLLANNVNVRQKLLQIVVGFTLNL